MPKKLTTRMQKKLRLAQRVPGMTDLPLAEQLRLATLPRRQRDRIYQMMWAKHRAQGTIDA